MGMWQTQKEISALTLEKLLERPWDHELVDGLLFADDGSWSLEATRTTLDDQALIRRFQSPYLPMSLEEMRTLGELDGGDFDPSLELSEDLPLFACLLTAGDPARSEDVRYLLSIAGPLDKPRSEVASELRSRFDLTPPESARSANTWVTPEGAKCYGFASTVPCYGINSFTPPSDIAAKWAALERVIHVHEAYRTELMTVFGPELKHYYGCAMRGSAELWVIW